MLMPKTQTKPRLPHPSLFDPIPQRPRWEDLPLPIRQQLTALLTQLLNSPVAREWLRTRPGGSHE